MLYEPFVLGLAIALAVAGVLELISRSMGLVRDECDRYFLGGFIGLLSGMLIPIVGEMVMASAMLGIGLISFMAAWEEKRKAEHAFE